MKIACLLESMFEDSEFVKPADAFRQAGHQVTVIGLEPGKDLKGYRGTATVRAEKGIDTVRPDEYDALFIPGGYSPDHLRLNPKVVSFTKAFFDADKPVFAICHGPQLLITARVVKGSTLTAWPTIQGVAAPRRRKSAATTRSRTSSFSQRARVSQAKSGRGPSPKISGKARKRRDRRRRPRQR